MSEYLDEKLLRTLFLLLVIPSWKKGYAYNKLNLLCFVLQTTCDGAFMLALNSCVRLDETNDEVRCLCNYKARQLGVPALSVASEAYLRPPNSI